MAERRLQIPAAIAHAAEQSPVDHPIVTDLARRLPVTSGTLLAASTLPDEAIATWAGALYRKTWLRYQGDTERALTAAGVNDGVACYGLMDPDADDAEIITHVVRRAPDGSLMRWQGSAWESVPPEMTPDGLPFAVLDGDLLADALNVIPKGVLVLRSASPRGYLQQFTAPITAAVSLEKPPGTVYAVVDDMDTGAVLTLFAVQPGPIVFVRTNGAWMPDDGALLAQLSGIDPPTVAPVEPAQVPDILRQVDDYDTAHPAPIPHPLVAAADSTGVMVALPVPPDLGADLVPGERQGEHPDDMHVTLVYLGSQDEAKIGYPELIELVREWARERGSTIPAQVSGPAVFKGEDTPAHVALIDAPDLPDARQDLVQRIQGAGGNVMLDHGFTPRITLAYGDNCGGPVDVDPRTINFDHVGVYHGNDRTYIPLDDPDQSYNPNEALTAAVPWQEDLHPRQSGKFAAKGTATQSGTAQGQYASQVSGYIAQGGAPPPGITPPKTAKSAGGRAAASAAAKQKTAAARAARQLARYKKSQHSRFLTDVRSNQADQVRTLQLAGQQHDDQFQLSQLRNNQAEQARRNSFDTSLTQRFEQYRKSGMDDNAAAAATTRDSQQEISRRNAWEQQRKATATSQSANQIQRRMTIRTLRMKQIDKMRSLTAGANPPAHSMMPDHLKEYWTKGKGAAKIRWGTHGDFKRCERQLVKYVGPERVAGMCANAHRLVLGWWPGKNAPG